MGIFDSLFGRTDRTQEQKEQAEGAEQARYSRLQALAQNFETLLVIGVGLVEAPELPSVADSARFEFLYRKELEALKDHDALCIRHDQLLARIPGISRDPAVLEYENRVRPYVGDLRFKVDDCLLLLKHPDGPPRLVAARQQGKPSGE